MRRSTGAGDDQSIAVRADGGGNSINTKQKGRKAMKHMGVEYTIHRGPRGWAWKIYADEESRRTPLKLGVAETRSEAIVLAQAHIDAMTSSKIPSAHPHGSAA
jgi:hypothetical protein